MIYLFASLLKLECLEELLCLITYACQVDFALESFSASHSMPSSYPHWQIYYTERDDTKFQTIDSNMLKKHNFTLICFWPRMIKIQNM